MQARKREVNVFVSFVGEWCAAVPFDVVDSRLGVVSLGPALGERHCLLVDRSAIPVTRLLGQILPRPTGRTVGQPTLAVFSCRQ
jgi:hypothetical protein